MKTLFKITLAVVVTSICLFGCVEEDPQPHAPGYTQVNKKQMVDVAPSHGPIK